MNMKFGFITDTIDWNEQNDKVDEKVFFDNHGHVGECFAKDYEKLLMSFNKLGEENDLL